MTSWQQPHPNAPSPGTLPSPRRRSHTRPLWPWLLGLGVLVLIILPGVIGAGSVLIGQWHAGREVTVTMEVTGTAPTARIDITRGDHSEPETLDKVAIPWRTTFTVTGADKHVSVTGLPDSELNTLSCTIVANGKLIAEDTMAGPLASCSGDANGDSSHVTTPTSTPAPPPTGPARQSDLWPGLVMPSGSVAQPNPSTPGKEFWEVPLPFTDTVTYLRGKLPVNSPFGGRPFCGEMDRGDLIVWSWGTQANEVYDVSITPNGITTGTDVVITRHSHRQVCR